MILALLLVGVAVGNVASAPPAPSDAGTGVIDDAEKFVGMLQKMVFGIVSKLQGDLAPELAPEELQKMVFDIVGKLQKMAAKDVGKLEEEVGKLQKMAVKDVGKLEEEVGELI